MIETNIKLTISDTYYVEPESRDLVAGWMLTMILKLGGHKELITERRMSYDDLNDFFGLEAYREDYERDNRPMLISALEDLKRTIDDINPKSTCTILENNIKKLCKIIELTVIEIDVLRFCIYLHYYELLENGARLLNDMTSDKFEHCLSVILGHPRKAIKEVFSSKATLVKNSFIAIDRGTSRAMKNKIDIISNGFADKMMSSDDDIEEMIRDVVHRCEKTTLTLQDYPHLSQQLDVLVPYMRHSIENKKSGTNILLYGRPGTGKTELVKAIAQEIDMCLYEVSYADEDGDPINGNKRLQAYRTAQSLFAYKPIILMFDEIEDVISAEQVSFFGIQKRQNNKGWMNHILESNSIPTIWITNSIYSMDDALIRRFDMAIEVPIPPLSKRRDIVRTCTNSMLENSSIELIASNEHVAPAIMTRAAKVIDAIKDQMVNPSKSYEMLIDNKLKAQGRGGIEKKDLESNIAYDPSYVNTSMGLQKLLDGIKRSNSARLCLYGVPGTGKSAFGKWIAQEIDKPFLLKKGSDLMSMYVGGTEKNIANAFREAKEDGAVLVFDEVDSFLQDRRDAKASWEVTQVNEMLVQMENYDGIFIATTNIMDGLDQASLRRFDLKLEFDYMKFDASKRLFEMEVHLLGIDKINKTIWSQLKLLDKLTPGDFAAVRRQSRFSPIESADELLERLSSEIEMKEAGKIRKMGFLK